MVLINKYDDCNNEIEKKIQDTNIKSKFLEKNNIKKNEVFFTELIRGNFRRESFSSRASSMFSLGYSDLSKTDDYDIEWVKDEEVTICMCCQTTEFTFYNRKHHCRACGNVVCGTCSGGRSKIKGLYGMQRICDECEYSMATNSTLSLPRISKVIHEEQNENVPEINEDEINEEIIKSMDKINDINVTSSKENQDESDKLEDNQKEEEEIINSCFPILHSPVPRCNTNHSQYENHTINKTDNISKIELELKYDESNQKSKKLNTTKINISSIDEVNQLNKNKETENLFILNTPSCGSCLIS